MNLHQDPRQFRTNRSKTRFLKLLMAGNVGIWFGKQSIRLDPALVFGVNVVNSVHFKKN